jgi:hypothetical protein
MRNAYKTVVEKLEGRISRVRWEDNFKTDLKEIRCNGVGWIHLAHNCEHSNEPSSFIKGGVFLDQLSDY